MDLNSLFGNWRTTFLAIAAAFVNQLVQVSGTLPGTKREWAITIFNALLVGLGWQAKDAAVGSKAGDS